MSITFSHKVFALMAAVALSLPNILVAQTAREKSQTAGGVFAELCAKSLPGMTGLETKVRAITARDFANSGGVDQPGVYVQGGSITTGIGFGVGSPAWKDSDGKYFCQTTVYNVPRDQAVADMIRTFTEVRPASVSLTQIMPAPKGTVGGWMVGHAKQGMTLTASKAPQNGVRFRLAWEE